MLTPVADLAEIFRRNNIEHQVIRGGKVIRLQATDVVSNGITTSDQLIDYIKTRGFESDTHEPVVTTGKTEHYGEGYQTNFEIRFRQARRK